MTGLLAAALLSLNPPSPTGPVGRIEGIEVRLFDTAKAAFSENVLDDAGFWSGWNTFLVEGNSGYGRGDALVLVRIAPVHPDNGYAYAEGTLTISAFQKGKLLAQRRFMTIGLPSGEGASQALYLADIGCSGEISIKAQYRDQVKRARLIFGCGE
jgi:hypothetical protein